MMSALPTEKVCFFTSGRTIALNVFDDIAQATTEDLEGIRAAIDGLQRRLSGASSMWQDDKYAALSDAVRGLSNESVELLKTGEQCSRACGQFGALTAERY